MRRARRPGLIATGRGYGGAMPESVREDRVVLVLSRSPMRSMMREWLGQEGYEVTEASAWEVDRLLAEGRAGVVVTSDDLDGEWAWSSRHRADVLVLGVRQHA